MVKPSLISISEGFANAFEGPKFGNAQYRTTQFPTETELATEGTLLKADDLVVVADGGRSTTHRASIGGAFCTLR